MKGVMVRRVNGGQKEMRKVEDVNICHQHLKQLRGRGKGDDLMNDTAKSFGKSNNSQWSSSNLNLNSLLKIYTDGSLFFKEDTTFECDNRSDWE